MSIPDEDPNEEVNGSIEQLDAAPDDVQDTDDGGAIVKMEDAPEPADKTSFYDNLVSKLPQHILSSLGNELHDAIEQDQKSREERNKTYEEGIRRTGLGNDAPGGAAFAGASRTVHPVLTKACVDFEARAVAELMPPSGAVKDYIAGKVTQKRVDKARRVAAHMNWQLRRQMPEFRAELEQMLSQLPLGGSQFMFLTWDAKRRRPLATYWPSDDVILPFAASSAANAERLTQIERITQRVYEQRVKSGYYAEPANSAPSTLPDVTKPAEASAKVEGVTADPYNQDGLRAIWRTYTCMELEGDDRSSGEFAPYIVEIDPHDSTVKSIVRNWEEEDRLMACMSWLIEFPFLPWRGALSIGLAHAIGSLSGAATGALRALLDSAHFNNLPGLVKLKGANFSGQSKTVDIGTIIEVEGGIPGVDTDIRRLLMAIPYNPPSPVLLQLLGEVVSQAEGFVQTTLKNLTEDNITNLPVGTALSAIEEGLKVMSGIHLRLHEAMTRLLEVLFRINRLYLTEEELKSEAGEVLAYRADYNGAMDVAPVSDPNIFSDAQRFAQTQLVAQRAEALPQLYDLRKVEELILERTRLPDAKNLLLPKQEPQRMNAVNENASMSLGRPVAVFPEQDHLGHLQVHLDYFSSPVLGQLASIVPKFAPSLLDHVAQHVALWYVERMYSVINAATQKKFKVEFSAVMDSKDPEVGAEVDKLLAQVSPQIMKEAQAAFASVPAVLQRAQQIIQQLNPQMPPDNSMGVAQINTQSREKQTQATLASREKTTQVTLLAKERERRDKLASDQQSHQQDAQQAAQDRQAEDNRQQREQENQKAQALLREQTALQTEREQTASHERMNQEDNETALTIAEGEMLSGEKVGVSTGTGINPSP